MAQHTAPLNDSFSFFFFLNLRGAIVSAEDAICSLGDTYIAYNGIYIPFAVALALLNRISVKVTIEIRKCFYFSCFFATACVQEDRSSDQVGLPSNPLLNWDVLGGRVEAAF